MTYSIVARDPDNGQLGVAVQSCWISVGAIVTWARPGIGAVATQSLAEPAYGPRCLDAMAEGHPAPEALQAARLLDGLPAVRQVGVVDAAGGAEAWTGELCIDHAGHVVGDGFAVQANMMGSPDVWPAMAEAFTGSSGDLTGRLLATLDAAEAAGGDARGVMSAAILVVEAEPCEPGTGTVVDLRVDRSEDPLGELGHLVVAADALVAADRAIEDLIAGDVAKALSTVDAALALLPGEANIRFSRVGALAAAGEIEAAAAEARSLVAERAGWETVIRSVAAGGMVPLPDGVTVEDLLGP